MGTTVDFQLPESLTIANVQGLHEQLEQLINQNVSDKIVIKADSVLRADTAGIQLVLSFVNSARDHQVALDWDAPSEKLISAVRVLGLEGALGLH